MFSCWSRFHTFSPLGNFVYKNEVEFGWADTFRRAGGNFKTTSMSSAWILGAEEEHIMCWEERRWRVKGKKEGRRSGGAVRGCRISAGLQRRDKNSSSVTTRLVHWSERGRADNEVWTGSLLGTGFWILLHLLQRYCLIKGYKCQKWRKGVQRRGYSVLYSSEPTFSSHASQEKKQKRHK